MFKDLFWCNTLSTQELFFIYLHKKTILPMKYGVFNIFLGGQANLAECLCCIQFFLQQLPDFKYYW